MGWTDRLSAAWDAATDVAESAWDAATDVADAAVEAVGDAAAATGDVIGTVGAAVDMATLGGASGILNVVDNTVLDAVDEVTGGLVDVDFDDGNLSAGVGVDGILHIGAAVGEAGVRYSTDVIDQSFDLGLTDEGLEVSGQAGIDWGPLPYYEGDVAIGPDGDVSLDGRIQGTLPTPIGVLSGSAEGGFVRDGDEWGARLDADGTLRLPSGSIVKGGVEASYLETDDGSALSLGVEGSYTQPGLGTVGGSVEYDRIEVGDVVAEHFEAGAYASGAGIHVEAGVSHTSVTTPDGSVGEWDFSGDVSGLGGSGGVDAPSPVPDASTEMTWPEPEPAPLEAPEPVGEFEHAIAAADDVEGSVDEMFGDLG